MNTKHSEARVSRLRILAFGSLWAAVSGTALLAPGCYGRNCEGGTETFGVDAGEGLMIDENTWASGPQVGQWLWFPRQRYYIFDIRALGGRTPERPEAYISGSPNPAKNGSSFVQGAGNLALFFNTGPNRIDVKNDSCSDYYLRLVLEVPPLPPALDLTDAGNDADADAAVDDDAGITDAGDADAGD